VTPGHPTSPVQTNPPAAAPNVAPHGKERNKTGQEHHGAQGETGAGCSIAGQIPVYLKMAENSRVRGDYEAAKRQFHDVLECEPGNEQARDGYSKTLRAQQEHLAPSTH
jgi:hypothetical protein